MKAIFERIDEDDDDAESEESNLTEGEVYNVNPMKNQVLQNKIRDEEITLPAFLDVSSVTVVDLKSVHVLCSNKNVAHMTYGEQSYQTDLIEGKNLGKGIKTYYFLFKHHHHYHHNYYYSCRMVIITLDNSIN